MTNATFSTDWGFICIHFSIRAGFSILGIFEEHIYMNRENWNAFATYGVELVLPVHGYQQRFSKDSQQLQCDYIDKQRKMVFRRPVWKK